MQTTENLEPDFNKTTFYTVENDDNIKNIAEKFLGDSEKYRKIMELNGLTNTTVFPGQILRVPQSLNPNLIMHRVTQGETLWKIAEKFLGHGNRYEEIMNLNGLKSDIVYPGQIIKIYIDSKISPKNYTVKKGDTLWEIAKKNLGDGTRYTEIMKLNNLTDGNIAVGQKLNLPKK